MLNLSYPDFVEKVALTAEENVMLDVERRDEYVEFIRYLSSDRKIRREADFESMPGLENITAESKTLEGFLFEQLELEKLDENYYKIIKILIENLDDFGFLPNYSEIRDKIIQELKLSRPTVDKALKLLQRFEPEGVGARDLKECLLIQVEEHNFDNDLLKKVIQLAISHHLEEIGRGDFAAISKALAIPENGVVEIAAFIKKNLNGNPASAFGKDAQKVIPSFSVEKTDKGYQLVNLETRYGPNLSLSKQYLAMLDDPKTDQKTREFLRLKFMEAKSLIEDITRRSETLERIARKIVETQKDFLDRGGIWLIPLPQVRLADEFGLHPSTISRAVSQKFIQTPQGLLPLKVLCPRGPKGVTIPRMKAMLLEIVKNEDHAHPMSDMEICRRMNDGGAAISRRTVAFYRKELNLPSFESRKSQ